MKNDDTKQKWENCVKYLSPECPNINKAVMNKMKAKDVVPGREIDYFTWEDIMSIDKLCEACMEFSLRN